MDQIIDSFRDMGDREIRIGTFAGQVVIEGPGRMRLNMADADRLVAAVRKAQEFARSARHG